MARLQRRIVGGVVPYKGRRIWAEQFGDLYLCKVDGREVGCFYTDIFAVETAGRQHIDDLEIKNGSKAKSSTADSSEPRVAGGHACERQSGREAEAGHVSPERQSRGAK